PPGRLTHPRPRGPWCAAGDLRKALMACPRAPGLRHGSAQPSARPLNLTGEAFARQRTESAGWGGSNAIAAVVAAVAVRTRTIRLRSAVADRSAGDGSAHRVGSPHDLLRAAGVLV